MDVALPLDRMTAAEKLRAMEEIWADLCRESEDVPSPVWHAEILRDREQRIADGTSRFLDVAEAKRVVRERLK